MVTFTNSFHGALRWSSSPFAKHKNLRNAPLPPPAVRTLAWALSALAASLSPVAAGPGLSLARSRNGVVGTPVPTRSVALRETRSGYMEDDTIKFFRGRRAGGPPRPQPRRRAHSLAQPRRVYYFTKWIRAEASGSRVWTGILRENLLRKGSI